eukprot:CAMPEP_0197911946 /NCGR_PEP_ID=MMETSP1439-20131203/73842_1 /TAXON_ID=66791 /ORGANISM="Gonyaulax spinifera, Strain CCMP409" /LENGTH=191 /DNA_ID=CAMNT_0043533709 /DNA_START=1 /DNA_END=576 /DNA_ORIENTATION=+
MGQVLWTSRVSAMASDAKPAAAATLPGSTPVVFLDVDGVLNSRETRKMKWSEELAKLKLDDAPGERLLQNLSLIVERTGGVIVLSSTWRLVPAKRAELVTALAAHGMSVWSDTPDLEPGARGDRGDEILLCLKELSAADGHMDRPWIAIDDMDLIMMNPRLEERHFVHTNDGVGLQAADAEEAIAKLEAQA